MPVRCISSAGVPVASTRPASIATIQSHCCASSMYAVEMTTLMLGRPRADVVDQRPELPPRERIDAGRRLVEDEQIRLVDQRAAQPDLLLHAARELAGGTIGEGTEPGGVEQLLDARPALVRRQARTAAP